MIRPYAGLLRVARAWSWGLALVEGDSMRPGLRPGDVVLTIRLRRPPRTGEVVVADVPAAGRLVVKRVAAVDVTADALLLASDDPSAGTDSRQWGPLPIDVVRGRVVRRLYRVPVRWR